MHKNQQWDNKKNKKHIYIHSVQVPKSDETITVTQTIYIRQSGNPVICWA